jgi:hypothetical protein
MPSKRELVALLYRADWTRLCLSGEVHGVDASVPTMVTVTRARGDVPFPPFPEAPPFEPFGPEANDRTLLLAPGQRYREENAGGRRVRGCDGERVWRWFADLPPGVEIRFDGRPRPPSPELLAPSWLLAGYKLTIKGNVTACGRPGVRVLATPRRAARGWRAPHVAGPLPAFHWPPVIQYDRVVAVVDTELGILLRCERRRGDQPAEVSEFRSFTVNPEVDAARFTAPAGSVFGDQSGVFPAWPLGGAGREAAKAVAGVAAGGLAAAIKYSLFGRPGPSRPTTWGIAVDEDDAEAAMPRDDPFPGDAADRPPVGEKVLHALYRSGGREPRFTATLHQWFDAAALLEAVPEPARKAGFGGVGFLVDTLRDTARDAGTIYQASSVRIGGWEKYRIDVTHPAGPSERSGGRDWRSRTRPEPLTIACDGQRRWQVYADRVLAGPADLPPEDLAELLDGSWLLECDLSGGEKIAVDSHRGYRVAAEGQTQLPSPLAVFDRLSFPAVAVLDAKSGRLLRLTRYKGGKPVFRSELRDVTPDESGDFGFEPPAGLRVVEEEPGPPGEATSGWSAEQKAWAPPEAAGWFMAKSAADAVRKRVDAAFDWIDSRRDTRPPT